MPDDVNQEVANLLTKVLPLICVIKTYFLPGSIYNRCQSLGNDLLYDILSLYHKGISIFKYSLYVNFYGTSSLCL